MKFRLWRRRLSVSAPRVAVRSSMPWPVRWLLGALVLGFSGALALWAFEFGKEIAGLDRNAKQELEALRSETTRLRADLAQAQSIANTSESLLMAEKAAQAQLALQIRQLEVDNMALRSDLGFFERLIPGSGSGELNIRGLQVERINQQPGEHTQPEVVEKDGHDLTSNINLHYNVMKFCFYDEKNLCNEETENYESMD